MISKFFGNLIARALTCYVKKELEKDKDLMKAVKDADDRIETFKQDIIKRKKLGMEIPDYLKPFDK